MQDLTRTVSYLCIAKGRAVESYESQTVLHSAFNQVFASSVGNTLVPAMHSVCKSTHRAAVAADDEVDSRDHANLNKAATLLQESFSRTFNDRKEFRPDAPFDDEGSKKAAVLGIVNELFSIYFRLNTLRLCKNLVKPVEGRKLHLQGSMGQMVTYQYFRGRLNLFEDNWAVAEENLEYAFSNCHKDAIHNKRCILRYLVPVKIKRGKLPTANCKFPSEKVVSNICTGYYETCSHHCLSRRHLANYKYSKSTNLMNLFS